MSYNKIYAKFQKPHLKNEKFLPFIRDIFEVDDSNLALELLQGCGFWLMQKDEFFELGTLYKEINDSVFCFVDIETIGSKPQDSKIIEIGAIKYHKGKIIDRFETLVYAEFVPEHIVELTGITTQMLEDAPMEHKILKAFREFLGDSIFVAHNVLFDYTFISEKLEIYGDFPLLNPRLCTIDLARKSILSLRYSLGYLNHFLGINIKEQHRALSDAYMSLEVFKIALLSLPHNVKNVQELIEFSRGKKL